MIRVVLGTCPVCGQRVSLDAEWLVSAHLRRDFGEYWEVVRVEVAGVPVRRIGGLAWCAGEKTPPIGLPTPEGIAGFLPLDDEDRGPVEPYVGPRPQGSPA